jgi:hypothetical protein
LATLRHAIVGQLRQPPIELRELIVAYAKVPRPTVVVVVRRRFGLKNRFAVLMKVRAKELRRLSARWVQESVLCFETKNALSV